MLNKYGKYIYSLIVFYTIWLVIIPIGFKFSVNPLLNTIKSCTEFNLSVENPQIITSVIPNLKFKADKIKLLNKDNSEALLINNTNINIRILPLFSGKIHLNNLQFENININAVLKDKLYLGDYPIEIKENGIKPKIKRVKIENLNIKINEAENKNNYTLSARNLYFKNTRTSFITHGKADFNINNSLSKADFDINLPHSKNLKKTKFNIQLNSFELEPFSDIINKCVYNEIVNLNGKIDLSTDNKNMDCSLKNIKITYKDTTKTIIFPDKFSLKARYKIGEDSFCIKDFTAKGENISANGKGKIKNIFSKTPNLNLNINLDKSDIRKGALMLPPIITPDINIPKLKQYPFYGNITGNLKIKGKIPEPDVTGNIKVTDGVLIEPILNASSGANINVDFVGKKCLLDVIVPAGGREVVYVSGDIMLYGDKYAHLKVRSSQSVDLNLTERVLNPVHEVFCFMIGPVPIMDVTGTGNIDIKIEGTKKDPHIWGDFNFKGASARFLEVNNLILENADGNLNFNNQNAHFINNSGTLHGQKATVDGICTLFGDLDFNVIANNQNLDDLIKILTTSPMLKDIKNLVPDVNEVNGKSDFHLHLGGKLFDINDLKINENVIPSGYIKLLGNSLKFGEIPVSEIYGQINYNKKDCDFDLSANITSASKSTIIGKIKDEIADIKIKSPRIRVNELIPPNLRYIDNLFVKMNTQYKGKLDSVELGGINSEIEVIKDYKPAKNGKITSGKITLKNSNLNIRNLNGVIKQNPFYIDLKARNIGDKKLNLSKATISGRAECKNFDLTILNLLKKANIFSPDIQNEIKKVEFKSGTADISLKAKDTLFSGVYAAINLKDIMFDYLVSQGKDSVIAPAKIISGNINVKNNFIRFNKMNCLVDSMPVLIYGSITDFYKNPQYNINLNSKLVQRIFDKYWNSNNIYPIKINGDILLSSNLSGNKDSGRVRANIKMEENSSIYYMGATVGDKLNPITLNLDADFEKNGKIKIHKFLYNKLITSQNNKTNSIPLLSVNGQLKNLGKVFELKDFTIKTENPANANFFNIIFKKPTIKSGNFTSNIKINGRSDKPKIIGKLNANNIEMPYLNTSIKDINVDFKPDIIHLTANGKMLDNYIMVNANIKNHLIAPYKINSADIYINDFDIDNSLEQLKQIELRGFSSAIASDNDSANLINSVLFNNLKIRAGNVQVKNIKASNLEAVCSLNEKMQISVDSFKFNMAGGLISGKLAYNLLNNFMQMELNSKGVNANELVIALFDLPNQIYGSLTGHIELSCNATNDKTKLSTLSGFGSFNVVNGKMPKLGSLEYLLRAGNLIKGGITGLSMNGIIDVITPMKTGEFSSIDGRIRLKDGIAKTIEIRSLGKNLSLYLIGSLNLSTQIANMHVYGQLSRKVSTILGAAGNLSLNTLFNKIPGISLDGNSQLVNELNKIPGIELSTKSNRRFMVEILGDINGDSFVKSFKWIN